MIFLITLSCLLFEVYDELWFYLNCFYHYISQFDIKPRLIIHSKFISIFYFDFIYMLLVLITDSWVKFASKVAGRGSLTVIIHISSEIFFFMEIMCYYVSVMGSRSWHSVFLKCFTQRILSSILMNFNRKGFTEKRNWNISIGITHSATCWYLTREHESIFFSIIVS